MPSKPDERALRYARLCAYRTRERLLGCFAAPSGALRFFSGEVLAAAILVRAGLAGLCALAYGTVGVGIEPTGRVRPKGAAPAIPCSSRRSSPLRCQLRRLPPRGSRPLRSSRPSAGGPYARQAAAAGVAIDRGSGVPRRRAPQETGTVGAGS